MEKIYKAFSILAWAATMVFAADESPKPTLEMSITTDAAYYLKNDYQTGEEHFAPVEGPYDGVEAITQFDATYTIPTPLGSNWLVKNANLKLTGSLELSPITIRPKISLSFTPLPFLVLSSGANIGTGWNYLGFDGLSTYNVTTQDYEGITPFVHYYYEAWIAGRFQFDLGAVMEGDWTHVVLLANYRLFYGAITGVDYGVIYQWQESANRANGVQYHFTGILGYQMPLRLSMVGAMFEARGHLDGADYGRYNKTFNGDFVRLDVSALGVISLNEKNDLSVLATFEGNRSYATDHEKESEEPLLTATGTEWTFYRIACSWEHRF